MLTLTRPAKDHPSHLAIYTRALAARKKYLENLQLRTYNEIFIVDAGNPPFEYFNCHPRTGLLPYARMLEGARALGGVSYPPKSSPPPSPRSSPLACWYCLT
jgi:hypothetical protein